MRKSALHVLVVALLQGCSAHTAQAWPVVPGNFAPSTIPSGGGGGGGGGGSAPSVYSGCTALPTDWSGGTTYYVKPSGSGGSDAANGLTLGTAWATMSKAISTAPAGSTIRVQTGSYGTVTISGETNASFERIIADTGQTPQFDWLRIDSSTKWLIQGITIQHLQSGSSDLVEITNGSGGADIVLDSNTIQSASDATMNGWTPTQFAANAVDAAVYVDSGDPAGTASVQCVAVTNNTIKNVLQGMTASAPKLLVQGNTLSRFGHDGIDFSNSNILIQGNTLTDSYDTGDGNHNDAMQGQIGRCATTSCTYDNVVLNANVIIEKNTPGLAHSTAASGDDLMGMDLFDMDWSNFVATNNIIVTHASNGLYVASVHTALVANNTVLNSDLTNTSDGGISVVKNTHEGTDSDHVTVINNIVSNLGDDAPTATYTYKNNWVCRDIRWWVGGSSSVNSAGGTYGTANTIDGTNHCSTTFTTLDTSTPSYDLHLAVSSPAAGTGTATGAPNKADGTARTGTVDPGAY